MKIKLNVFINYYSCFVTFSSSIPVLLRGLYRWARGRGPAGLPAPAERPGPAEPHLPLPPLGGLGRPQRQEQPQEGAALQSRQRRRAELRDQPVHQGSDGRLLCESSAFSSSPSGLQSAADVFLCFRSIVKASTGRSWRSTRHRWSIFPCWTSRCQTLGRATSSLALKWDLSVSRAKHTHTIQRTHTHDKDAGSVICKLTCKWW